jgi:hypothetical protein
MTTVKNIIATNYYFVNILAKRTQFSGKNGLFMGLTGNIEVVILMVSKEMYSIFIHLANYI